MGANPLDATAPTVRRGKEREIPKAKKPSALKKVSCSRWYNCKFFTCFYDTRKVFAREPLIS